MRVSTTSLIYLLPLCVLVLSQRHAAGEDVRKLTWGDSLERVIAAEPQLTLKRDEKPGESVADVVALLSEESEDLCGEKVRVGFLFWKNRLTRVSYDVDISASGNPFQHDARIRTALTKKYGDECMTRFPWYDETLKRVLQTTTLVNGLGGDGKFDSSEFCSRSSEWVLPRHKIELSAIWCPLRDGRLLKSTTVIYTANNDDYAEYSKAQKEQAEALRKQRDDESKQKL